MNKLKTENDKLKQELTKINSKIKQINLIEDKLERLEQTEKTIL